MAKSSLQSSSFPLRSREEIEEGASILLPLFKLLNGIQPISKALEEMLIKNFRSEKIKKGTILLHEGNISENLCFLAEGVLRSFHTIGEKDITSRLMFSGHIVISAGSFFKQAPATESIEALTDCVLARLRFSDLQDIYARFPEFNYHARLITEDYFHKQEQRLYMLRKQDALHRYEFFLEHYASYLKDIPQKYIASFLNITPETLSRTRNKLRSKQHK